ncbi:hypothetical protein ILYODFUR_012257 [Ilyodon furcidens]|uniref:Uncharacterized protein n=1 Tax=Ilyodon furcidens TaxID=33524 RepID=A0ABV0SMT1_9TELE
MWHMVKFKNYSTAANGDTVQILLSLHACAVWKPPAGEMWHLSYTLTVKLPGVSKLQNRLQLTLFRLWRPLISSSQNHKIIKIIYLSAYVFILFMTVQLKNVNN